MSLVENTALADDSVGLGEEDSQPWDSEDAITQEIPQVTSPQKDFPPESAAPATPSAPSISPAPEESPQVSQLREQVAVLQQQVQQLLAAREITPHQCKLKAAHFRRSSQLLTWAGV